MYKILYASSISQLEDKVNNYRKDGWVTQGGMAVGDNHMGRTYYQAMIKPYAEAKVIDMFPKSVFASRRAVTPSPSMS
jgi:hypothetical protein